MHPSSTSRQQRGHERRAGLAGAHQAVGRVQGGALEGALGRVSGLAHVWLRHARLDAALILAASLQRCSCRPTFSSSQVAVIGWLSPDTKFTQLNSGNVTFGEVVPRWAPRQGQCCLQQDEAIQKRATFQMPRNRGPVSGSRHSSPRQPGLRQPSPRQPNRRPSQRQALRGGLEGAPPRHRPPDRDEPHRSARLLCCAQQRTAAHIARGCMRGGWVVAPACNQG